MVQPGPFLMAFVFGSNQVNVKASLKFFENCELQIEHKKTRRPDGQTSEDRFRK